METRPKNKKKYEPPVVKEIGGVFDQAMGISKCEAGNYLGYSCTVGGWDFNCLLGQSDGAACTTGIGNTGNCQAGPRGPAAVPSCTRGRGRG